MSKTFYAIKKPLPIKFYDPLKMTDEELKELNVWWEENSSISYSVGNKPLFIGTLESLRYEFTARTHLIVEGFRGEIYAIERNIFKETYELCNEAKSDKIHTSDCAVHNEPAFPKGECDCDEFKNDQWFVLNSAGMHYSDGDERITNFIEEEITKNGLKYLECLFQDGAVREVGINGLQWQQLLVISLSILKKLNADFPCRENSITITKLEEALMWQEKRTQERIKRGVEGLKKD